MKLHIITNREELYACQSQWDRLAAENSFFSWDWNVSWFRELSDSKDSPFVMVGLDDDDNWIGIAPLFISNRALRLLGSGTACTDYANLICPDEHYQAFADAIAQYLVRNIQPDGSLSRINLLELEGGAHNDHLLNYFCDQLAALGLTQHQLETEGTWKVQLPESSQQLTQMLSSSTRRKVRKARKRLAAENVSVEFATPANFETIWTHFVELHQKRRIQLGEPGCFADPTFEAFLKNAIRGLLDRELADLFIIYNSEVPCASQLLIHSESSCMMYQSGVNPDFLSDEPGYQAIVVAMDRGIERGAAFYDFLRGDESYKSRWNTTREPILRRRFIPRKLSAQLKHNTWVAGRTIKNYFTSMMQPT